MATVQSVLDRKGSQVVTIDVAETVLAAAKLMNERAIGGLVVLDDGQVAGMFTERDILRRVVAAQLDPARTPVGDVMTTQVAFCRRDTLLDDCRAVMTERRIRHLPVMDDQCVCGIVTIGDLTAHEVNDREATIQYLNEYIFGVR